MNSHPDPGSIRLTEYKQTFLQLVLLSIVFFIACQEEVLPPDPPKPPDNDPRQYSWTIDTLRYPGSFQTAMWRMWGASGDDIFIVGHNDIARAKMYHYDGMDWSVVPLTAGEGGNIWGGFELSDIGGTDGNRVFAVGSRFFANPNPPPLAFDSSLVIYFDGVQWQEIESSGIGLLAIAENPGDTIYASGYGTGMTLVTEQGTHVDPIPVAIPSDVEFGVYSMTSSLLGGVHALAGWYRYSAPESQYYFLHREVSGNWIVVDTVQIGVGMVENRWGYAKVWQSAWGTLYSIGSGVFEFHGAGWTRVMAGDSVLTGIAGTAPDDIFVVGHFGQCFHFNGDDWYRFPEFQDTGIVFSDVLVFEDEVFLLGTDAGANNTFVVHGE